MDTLRLFIGFDPREAVAYHVFCQSVIEKASIPVAFYPLHRGMLGQFDGQRDGSNAFTFSRYLVPHLCDYRGWALYADGDMVCERDIAELWALREGFNKGVSVVQHEYRTTDPLKYRGTPMESANSDYPRKNWSSLILWNCDHFSNHVLTPDFVRKATPTFLHRFQWLQDDQIGSLPTDWNHLVGEYPHGPAGIYHHTLGVPGIEYYADGSASWKWHSALLRALECAGEDPVKMTQRSQERIGAVR